MVTRRFRFCSRKYREPLEKVAIHGKREGGKAGSLHARLHAVERGGRVRRLATPLASPLWAVWRGGRYRDWPATGSRGRTSINYSK